MAKPLLAVDIDGVIVLFGPEEPAAHPPVQIVLIDGMLHYVSLVVGERLLRLSAHYDLVWASGWEGRANEHFPELLGIPELPYLSFDGAARFGSADWKRRPLETYGQGRPLAWVDDSFDEDCHEWARSREAPTLLVPVDSRRGLEDTHVEELIAWAAALEDRGEPAG